MEQKPLQSRELPDEALGITLKATITSARYNPGQDMTTIMFSVTYMGKEYTVRKNMWAGRGNTVKDHESCLVGMCEAKGLDYDSLARSVPERLDLEHRKFDLEVVVRKSESGRKWIAITWYGIRQEGKERTREEILEDITFKLNQQVADMEMSLCMLADTQQKAESECRRLRQEYEALAAEYRSVVFERDDLRRRLGMEPGRSVAPGNLIQMPGPSGNPPRRAYRKQKEEDLVQNDEILQAFLDGQL